MVALIIPKYFSDRANAVIDLATGPVELTVAGEVFSGTGTARLDLAADGRVIVDMNLDSSVHALIQNDNLFLKFGPNGHVTPVISTRSKLGTNCTTLSVIARKGPLVFQRDGRIRLSSATIHILNFPDFYCLGGEKTDFFHEGRRLGRVILRCGEWEIEIQALPRTQEIVTQLKTLAGNAITHVARITQKNGKGFTPAKLETLVGDLHRYLSFARGSWTSVFGTVAYDIRSQEAYLEWGMRIATPWQVCPSWFDIHHGECLAAAFPGFVNLLHDPHLGGAAFAGLYWYLRSNRAGEGSGVDGGLVLSQAALEGLSMSIVELSGHKLPARPSAADKIRAACTHLGISTMIPTTSKALLRAKRNGDFKDAPEAVTRVRNELVHPRRRLKSNLSPLTLEAWHLAQWYIEVMLLTLAGYDGVYSHRLVSRWVGQVQNFP
jgi:hypothetical protein